MLDIYRKSKQRESLLVDEGDEDDKSEEKVLWTEASEPTNMGRLDEVGGGDVEGGTGEWQLRE